MIANRNVEKILKNFQRDEAWLSFKASQYQQSRSATSLIGNLCQTLSSIKLSWENRETKFL